MPGTRTNSTLGTTALAAVLLSGAAPAPPAVEALPPDYGESVALVGWSADGRRELSVRMARFPGRGAATLWLAILLDEGDEWSVALEDVEPEGRERTPVEASEVAFAVSGPARARFECRARDSAAMVCTVEAEALAHRTRHPPLGSGTVPVRVSARFTASHRGVPARSGRFEVFGSVEATLETPAGVERLSAPGKWHEQTGERPRFAGAFTYLSVSGEQGSLLAIRSAAATSGFALVGGRSIAVRELTIDPVGPPRRRFRAALADGGSVEGEAVLVRETSVPIEGRRRPGATVRVTSSLGEMVGHLNDWKPDP